MDSEMEVDEHETEQETDKVVKEERERLAEMRKICKMVKEYCNFMNKKTENAIFRRKLGDKYYLVAAVMKNFHSLWHNLGIVSDESKLQQLDELSQKVNDIYNHLIEVSVKDNHFWSLIRNLNSKWKSVYPRLLQCVNTVNLEQSEMEWKAIVTPILNEFDRLNEMEQQPDFFELVQEFNDHKYLVKMVEYLIQLRSLMGFPLGG